MAPKRLVLCFDGTGNTFSGSTSDTNIVKLYDKFDRNDESQYHYYQTGIGTYDADGGTLDKGFFGRIRSTFSRTVDAGLGTTFDAHVIAGYRFLMRYYDNGDKIYMFGFSRGAFTARYLARMIAAVGLLSKGNEEMVPFAYHLYRKYVQGEFKPFTEVTRKPPLALEGQPLSLQSEREPLLPNGGMDSPKHEGQGDLLEDNDMARQLPVELKRFASTFCRSETVENGMKRRGAKVFFLGMFDCVNSVAILDGLFGKSPPPVSVIDTAEHVRHAVAVDERRVKFKAALLAQEEQQRNDQETLKEVWFPGNHGDVGGGWPAPVPNGPNQDSPKAKYWDPLMKILRGDKPQGPSNNVANDPYQMSDIPLAWMIREIEEVGKLEPDSKYAISWDEKDLGTFKRNFQKRKSQALDAEMHDTMRPGRGSSLFKVILWNIMEWIPFIPRWELEYVKKLKRDGWVRRTLPPNMGRARDIPKNAVIHASLLWRLRNKNNAYRPRNNHGEGKDRNLKPCLVQPQGNSDAPYVWDKACEDPDQRTYGFRGEVGKQMPNGL